MMRVPQVDRMAEVMGLGLLVAGVFLLVGAGAALIVAGGAVLLISLTLPD
jgi:hypothetical protein